MTDDDFRELAMHIVKNIWESDFEDKENLTEYKNYMIYDNQGRTQRAPTWKEYTIGMLEAIDRYLSVRDVDSMTGTAMAMINKAVGNPPDTKIAVEVDGVDMASSPSLFSGKDIPTMRNSIRNLITQLKAS